MPCSQTFHLDPLNVELGRYALNMVLPYTDTEYVLIGFDYSSKSE